MRAPALLLLSALASGQRIALELNKPLERELTPRQTHEFSIQASAGQFFHVAAEQKGVDIVLTLIDPRGVELFSTDSTPAFGFEHASALSNQGGVYLLKAKAKEAALLPAKYTVELRDLRSPTDSDLRRIQAEALLRAAVADEKAGTRESRLRAIDEFTKANVLWHAIGETYEEGLGLSRLGLLSSNLGDRPRAMQYFQQAQSLEQAVGDLAGAGATLNGIGNAFADLGDAQKALQAYQQALAARRAVGDRVGEAATLSNIGIVYSVLDEKPKALDYFGQALAIKRAVGDRVGEAGTLNNMGVVYYHLGDMKRALESYLATLNIMITADNWPGEAALLINIGNVYADTNEPKKALEYYLKALPLQHAAGNWPAEAGTLTNLGNAYFDLDQRPKALEYHLRALPAMRGAGNRIGEATALNNIGADYFYLGEEQKALQYYQQALPLQRATGARGSEALTLKNLMRLLRTSRPELAIFFGKQAVNVLQSIRRDNQGLEAPLRKSYDESIESYYRTLADILIERNRFGEAEEVLDLLKNKETADFLRSDSVAGELRAATLLDFEKKALERYEQIVNQVVVLGQQKAALIAKSDKAPLTAAELSESTRLDGDLDAANTVLRRFFDEQGKAFAADSGLTKRVQEFKEAEGLQDALQKLGPDVVAIYTLVTPDKYVAMLVTSGARKAYTSKIAETELNKKIFEFRQKLQDSRSNPIPLAQELYRIVFPEGLRQDLDAIHVKTIMWSIDNTLRYVPIAALHDGKDYLVKSFRNSMITPASMPNLTEEPSRQWAGVGFGVSESRAPLPSVPGELRGIFREQPGSTSPIAGSVRLNADFTRANFEQDLRRQRNRVVHIATHFASRPGTAADSLLLLGDGPMSLAEIESKTRLFNGVDLLTLSACETAFANRNEDGREVDSFGTIAQRLGAKGVVASLWSVNDASTSRLMQEMYRLREESGMPKSEALREAQLALLTGAPRADGAATPGRLLTLERSAPQSGDWSHPFYWAPFILIGNWK